MKHCVCYVMIFALGVLPFTGWSNTGHTRDLKSNPTARWATSTIQGILYEDLDENKVYDYTDVLLPGIGVEAFQDLNYNGQIDDGDAFIANAVSGQDGQYFLEVSPSHIKRDYTSVSATADDASENFYEGVVSLDGQFVTDAQEAGFRFDNLEIPRNAVILEANLIITPATSNQGLSYMSLNAELVDNAPSFTDDSYNILSRTRTENSLDWMTSIPVTAESTLEIEGLEAIVSEVIKRDGWESGNAMAIMMWNFNLDFYTFDGGFAPKLNITWVHEGQTDVHYLVRPVQPDLPEEFGDANTSIVETTVFEDISHIVRNFGFTNSAIVLAEENNVFSGGELNVWPNPTSGPINISLSNEAANKNYTMMIFDAAGKIVDQKTLFVGHNEQLQYDMSTLTNGVYIIGMTDGADMLTHKVILQ
ncbi:MAG: T9SS type A sorting domain-containing protein [Bacteroidetes bacterium]|nr:T9SS type A sorting domain-containing protein [Bacteroidota bacterium]